MGNGQQVGLYAAQCGDMFPLPWSEDRSVVNYQYLAGAFALLILAWLGLRAIQGRRADGKAGASTLMMRAIIGIITGLTTRILVQDSGLGHSDATLVALPIGAGLAVALIYRG